MAILAPDPLPALPPALAIVTPGAPAVGGSRAAQAARSRGLVALSSHRWSEASRELEGALQGGSRGADTYVGLAWSYVRRGQPGMAYIPLQEGLKLAPTYQPGWRELSRCFYLARRYDRAEQAAQAATTLDPSDGEAWLLRGLAAARGSQPIGAITYLTMATRFMPSDALPFRVKGEVFMQSQHLDLAIPTLKTSLRLDPANADAKRLLATALRASGRHGEALGLRFLREGEAP